MSQSRSSDPLQIGRGFIALTCSLVLAAGDPVSFALVQTPTAPNAPESARIPADQLDALVAPVALYPDPLLAQILAASTYPLEIIQVQQWLANHMVGLALPSRPPVLSELP